jgi:hypothetical protein
MMHEGIRKVARLPASLLNVMSSRRVDAEASDDFGILWIPADAVAYRIPHTQPFQHGVLVRIRVVAH